MPRLIKLEQGTEQWHKWRQCHLGGSDAPAVMFLDRYGRDRYKVWLEKTGRKKPESINRAMQKGIDLEPVTREEYCIENGVFAAPACLECTREGFEFMAASLDGLVPGSHIIEIKCPSDARDHISAKEGHIPEQYFCQIQHQLFVAELPRCDYVSRFEGERITVPIAYDPGYAEEIAAIEKEFWPWVLEDCFPFPNSDITVDLDQNPEMLNILDTYLVARRKREEAQDHEDEVLARLKARLADVGRATGLGATLHWQLRKGYLDLKAIPAVQEILRSGIDLEEYRRPQTLSFYVERGK